MNALAHIASRDWRPGVQADKPPATAAIFTSVNTATLFGRRCGAEL